MTNPEIIQNPAEPTQNRALRKVMIAIIGGITFLFLLAFLAGFTVAAMEHDALNAYDIGVIVSTSALAGLTVFVSYKLWPKGADEPVPAREKKSQNILWAALVVGALLGGYMAFASSDNPNGIFSNEPITASFAVVSIATWLIIVPIITWAWWRTIDEHEADAYREGALVSAHAYLFLVPSWWMAARAGWLPDQDPMIIFIIIITIWCAVWLYRKYF